jgi:copper chaperone CopZ
MKKILLPLLALFFIIPVFSQVKSARLQAGGLTCAMCARAVYKGLESLKFIDKIDTDLNESAFLINFKDGSNVDIDAIKKAVEGAGFSVASLELTAVFQNTVITTDGHLQLGGNYFHFVGVNNKSINGEQRFRVIDKDYLSAREQKKYTGTTKMECFKTGKAGECCKSSGIQAEKRIYHVTI